LPSLAYAGIPYQSLGKEGWRVGFDDGMEPLAYDAIRSLHRSDLREHGAFPVRLLRARAGLSLPESCFFLCDFHKWSASFVEDNSSRVAHL
jgi:hypothetical protein